MHSMTFVRVVVPSFVWSFPFSWKKDEKKGTKQNGNKGLSCSCWWCFLSVFLKQCIIVYVICALLRIILFSLKFKAPIFVSSAVG